MSKQWDGPLLWKGLTSCSSGEAIINRTTTAQPDENEMAALVEGARIGTARSQVESHMAGCQECQSVVAEYLRAASQWSRPFSRRRGKGKPHSGSLV